MRILKDITINSYLDYLNSDNNSFRKFYSDGIDLENQRYKVMFSDEELLMELIGVEDNNCPKLIENNDPSNDFYNSVQIYTWLESLSLADANDPRFWTTLTHVNFQNYTRKRWEINHKTTNETIKQRYYYVGGGMQARLRNSISRLWWIPKLTVRNELEDRFTFTKIVWSAQDLMSNLFERSLGTYPKLRFAILKFYSERKYDTKQFRVFFKELNSLGAMTPLNLLTESAVLEFLHRVEKIYFPDLETNLNSKVNIENIKIDTLLDVDYILDFRDQKSNKSDFSEENENKSSENSISINDSNYSNDSIDTNLKPVVYVKKLNDQDIERTPSISIEAVINFLKIKLNNDEETKLLCNFKGKEIEVELKKRKTRNEYRLFLNKYRNLMNYSKNDLLEFRYKSGKLCLEIIKYSYNIRQNPRYKDYNSRLGKKSHLLL